MREKLSGKSPQPSEHICQSRACDGHVEGIKDMVIYIYISYIYIFIIYIYISLFPDSRYQGMVKAKASLIVRFHQGWPLCNCLGDIGPTRTGSRFVRYQLLRLERHRDSLEQDGGNIPNTQA